MARAERADRSKPYGRPRDGRSADASGSWKHDLHPSAPSSSLADRLSGSSSSSGSGSRPSLLSRISGGQGKELLPSGSGKSKLFGFGTQPPINGNNANAGLELLPSGSVAHTGPQRGGRMPRGFQAQPGQRSLVQNGFNAALGLEERNRRDRRPAQVSRELLRDDGRQNGMFGAGREVEPMVSAPAGVSILGAGKTTVLVRVANLAYGTTAEDVVSAFAPLPILNATTSSPPSASLVSVDLELGTVQEANELISKYDGQIADGNKLSVTIVRQSLKDRMSSGTAAATTSGSGLASLGGRASTRQEPVGSSSRSGESGSRGQELLSAPGAGKMYSDTILQSDPKAYIQTLAEERAEAERNRQRASARSRNGGQAQAQPRSQNGRNGGGRGGGGGGGSLAARLGGAGGGAVGSYRGRGTASGMMVD